MEATYYPLSTRDLLRRDGCLMCLSCGLHVIPFAFKHWGRCPHCGSSAFDNARLSWIEAKGKPMSTGRFREMVR